MAVTVDLQQACETSIPDITQFRNWIELALANSNTEQMLASKLTDCELTIRIVDEQESAALNQRYRGKAQPTNVLSFPFFSPVPIEPVLLGDLVICANIVEQEARQHNKLSQHHWAHITVHGCLHLLGYDHIKDDEAEIMETLEVTILKLLSISDPYQDQGVR